MMIPTQLSLHGFIATKPELTYGKSDVARFRARVGVERWRKEPDGSFTKLDPQFCEMVMFKAAAERAYSRFRAGDQFVASGYVHEYEYEYERDGETVQREEFVARRIGHDTARTRYSVERPAAERATGPESDRDAQRTVEPSSTAVGI